MTLSVAIVDFGLPFDGETLLSQGLGGSESAIIYISRELVKIGFSVTVYNNCDTQRCIDGVTYVPRNALVPTGVYDIFISSRSVFPFMASDPYYHVAMSAKYRILWMHDTFCSGDEHVENLVVSGAIHEIFTLSDWHTIYLSTCSHGQKRMFEVLKRHIWQTRNGAVNHVGEIDLTKKDKDLFVYNASATKGLVPLVTDIWPKIKHHLPRAKLVCIGGFYNFGDGSAPDEQENTVREFMNNSELSALNVSFTGVITQHEVSKILARSNFMIYPPDRKSVV